MMISENQKKDLIHETHQEHFSTQITQWVLKQNS